MTYSIDVGKLIVIKYAYEGWSMQHIADDLYIHRETVADRINLWLAGESLVKTANKGCLHQDRQNSTLVLNIIAAAVEANETIYLDELADIVEEQTGVAQCEENVCKALFELKLTRKKVNA